MAKTVSKKGGSKAKALYSDALAETLCERYATSIKTLGQVCDAEGMPSIRTVLNWRNSNPDFAAKFYDAESRHVRACVDYAWEVSIDQSRDAQLINGKTNSNVVQRARLIADVALKRGAKMRPDTWGDLTKVEHTGRDGGPIENKDVSNVELARWMEFELNKAGAKGVPAVEPLALPAPTQEPIDITPVINPQPEPVEVKREPKVYEHFGSLEEQGFAPRRLRVIRGRRG